MTVRDDIAAERAALADSLEHVGPQAPTACGDWTAFDLAAHVVASEEGAGVPAYCVRTLAARGVPFRPNPRLVDGAISRQRRGGYLALVSRIRRACPRLLDSTSVAASTLFELWMHHDDLTSVNGLSHRVPAHLALAIPSLVRYQARRLPRARLTITVEEDRQWWFGPKEARAVAVSGSAPDIVRWLAGRTTAAALNIDGDEVVADQRRTFAGRIG